MTKSPQPFLGLVVGACAALSPALAAADVLEIDSAGALVVHRGPITTTATGVQPITPPKAPAQTRMAAPPAGLQQDLTQAGNLSALSPRLLEAVAWAESRFRQQAVSPKGAVGVMQLMPGTAAELGVDPHEPSQNVRGGALYLRQMLEEFDGDLERALAAYNAGPAAVRRYGGVPPFKETRAYVAAVMNYLAGQITEAEQ